MSRTNGRTAWVNQTRALLEYLDDHRNDFQDVDTVSGRKAACAQIANAFRDPTTHQHYTALQADSKLRYLCRGNIANCAGGIGTLLKRGSSYLVWDNRWTNQPTFADVSKLNGQSVRQQRVTAGLLQLNGSQSPGEVVIPKKNESARDFDKKKHHDMAVLISRSKPSFSTEKGTIDDGGVVALWNRIATIIQETVSSYALHANIHSSGTPDFEYIEENYPDTTALLQRVFFLGADEGLEKPRLARLGLSDIPQLWYIIQALIASGVRKWVLRKPPKNSLNAYAPADGNENDETRAIEYEHSNHAAPDPYSWYEAEGSELATRMAKIIQSLITPSNEQRREDDGFPPHVRNEWERNLREVFEKSLILKEELDCTDGTFNLLWAGPHFDGKADFNYKWMSSVVGLVAPSDDSQKISICLHPGIYVKRMMPTGDGEECLQGQVLRKATVLLRNS